jgi:hypothetical protein
MKICPVGAESFHVERRTDMNLTVALFNFANAPKIYTSRILKPDLS